jgi:hypothetical protein
MPPGLLYAAKGRRGALGSVDDAFLAAVVLQVGSVASRRELLFHAGLLRGPVGINHKGRGGLSCQLIQQQQPSLLAYSYAGSSLQRPS